MWNYRIHFLEDIEREKHLFQTDVFAMVLAQSKRKDRTRNGRRNTSAPSTAFAIPKQVQKFAEDILDVDRNVQKNVRVNYVFAQPRDAELFRFEPIPVSFEPIGKDKCDAFLYLNTICDLIDFSLRDCIAENVPVRRSRPENSAGTLFPYRNGRRTVRKT